MSAFQFRRLCGTTVACLAVLFGVVFTAAAQTPPVTNIVVDTAPNLSAGTLVTTPDGTAWTISGGTYTGTPANPYANLFHSFQAFDLEAGDTAYWSGAHAPDVVNVINRVSGGDPSHIYGTLNAMAFPNADFYFINPAGIVFGNGFHVNVPQGFYVSTADSLRFSDGSQMMAATASGSTFAMASPANFGFLGGGGNIDFASGVSVSSVATAPGAVAQFSAVNITMTQTAAYLASSSARMLAVGNTALSIPVDSTAALPTLSGTLSVTNSTLSNAGCFCPSTPGLAAGGLSLYGGTVTLAGSALSSSSSRFWDAGPIRISGTNVSISDSTLSNATGFATRGGAISVSGAGVALNNATLSTYTTDAGPAGDITIQSTAAAITDFRSHLSSVSSDFSAGANNTVTGATGNIALRSAGDMTLTGSTISTQAEDYAVRAGAIDLLAAGKLSIQAATVPGGGVFIFAVDNAVGSYLAPGAGTPAPGIRLQGNDVEIRGINQRTDRTTLYTDRVNITSTTTTDHPAGDIVVTAAHSVLVDRGDLLATTVGTPTMHGTGGTLRMTADNITFTNALLESGSLSGGTSGGAVIQSRGDLTFSDFSVLSSAASGGGGAGDITLQFVGKGLIDSGSRIDSDVSGSGANAGDISILSADGVLTIRSTGPSTPQDRITTVSTSTGNSANGGEIMIDVAALDITNGAGILSIATASASGTGGSIAVTADAITVEQQGSSISASSLGASAAGSISLNAPRISIFDGGGISTDSVSGPAGLIDLTLPQKGILMLSGRDLPGTITTSSGPGSGGQITISRPAAVVSNGGKILALGEIHSAKVQIDSGYFIRSTDRSNLLSVDGILVIDSLVEDVSRGSQEISSEFVDANGVLSGRCASARASGKVSQLQVSAPGPFSPTGAPSQATAHTCHAP